MSEPPLDRSEFWIRFICAFIFFGLILALLSVRFLMDYEVALVIVGAVIADGLISVYAARHGDSAWERILSAIGALCWWT